MVSNDDFDGKATHLNCFYLHINFEQKYPELAIGGRWNVWGYEGWSSPYLSRLVNPVPFQSGGRGRLCTPLCLSSPFFFHFCGPVFQSCLVWQSHGVPCMDRYLPHYIADTLCSSYTNQVPKSCFLKAS